MKLPYGLVFWVAGRCNSVIGLAVWMSAALALLAVIILWFALGAIKE